MSKYLFESICPICLDGSRFVFYHDCGGKRFIDEDLYLHCEKCNDKTFILDSEFKCDCNNHNYYEKVDKYDIISCISQISNLPSITGNVRKNMLKKLKDY